MLRVLLVGLGPLGRRIAADLVSRRLGEIAAAVDPADGIAGQRLGELVPETRSALPVARDLDALGPVGIREVDCAIVATSSELARCAPAFRALLGRGLAVVSTCEELAWPWLRSPQLAAELDRLAVDRGGRLLGTGVNPGFLMDAVPLIATAVCRSVAKITVERLQDASIRRVQFQKKIGVGLDERAFRAEVEAGRLRHVGLGESLHLLSAGLGAAVERWSETIDPVRAERDLESALGPVPAGRVSGVRQEARGECSGGLRLHLFFQASIGEPAPEDRVAIDGDPPVDLVWRGGVPGDEATSAIVLNAIEPLRSAPPGLHTMATIPLVRWNAAAERVRGRR